MVLFCANQIQGEQGEVNSIYGFHPAISHKHFIERNQFKHFSHVHSSKLSSCGFLNQMQLSPELFIPLCTVDVH